jgi:hypothetical protein
MLTAVWAAVVAAAAAFVIGVGVAVYVMLKAARLMNQSSAAIASLREREDLLIERAGAAIDRAGEQIARTEAITVSMDEVTASMAELRGRITALTPAAGADAEGASSALTWAAALTYGLARALGLRWAAQWSPRPHHPVQDRFVRRRESGAQEAAARPARPTPVPGRRPALTGRRGGAAP